MVDTFAPPTFSGENYLQANVDLLLRLGNNPVAATVQFIEEGFAQGRPAGDEDRP